MNKKIIIILLGSFVILGLMTTITFAGPTSTLESSALEYRRDVLKIQVQKVPTLKLDDLKTIERTPPANSNENAEGGDEYNFVNTPPGDPEDPSNPEEPPGFGGEPESDPDAFLGAPQCENPPCAPIPSENKGREDKNNIIPYAPKKEPPLLEPKANPKEENKKESEKPKEKPSYSSEKEPPSTAPKTELPSITPKTNEIINNEKTEKLQEETSTNAKSLSIPSLKTESSLIAPMTKKTETLQQKESFKDTKSQKLSATELDKEKISDKKVEKIGKDVYSYKIKDPSFLEFMEVTKTSTTISATNSKTTPLQTSTATATTTTASTATTSNISRIQESRLAEEPVVLTITVENNEQNNNTPPPAPENVTPPPLQGSEDVPTPPLPPPPVEKVL